MQLVVFAVVLILPAFLSAASLSGIQYISNCDGYIKQGGELLCEIQNTTYLDYDREKCTLICGNGEGPKLPNGVCSNGVVNCTSEVEKKLEHWDLKIQEYQTHF
uniref:Putative ixodes 10 kDa peptide protein n=1 Tax=Ixodes ricinus TaxID=34613 RepID=A0A0K8RCV7_IXORI